MRINILLLLLVLFAISSVNSQGCRNIINAIRQFRRSFRQSIGTIRRLCPLNNENYNVEYDRDDTDDDNPDDDSDDNEDDNDSDDNNNDNIASNFQNHCVCRLGTNKRIVNGKVSDKDEFPWHVSLSTKISQTHFCGGAIVNENTVITALHCVSFIPKNLFEVRVGLNNLKNSNPKNTYQVDKIIGYSRKVNFLRPSDIAIIKLKDTIRFVRGKIEPACFNLNRKNYRNSKLLATGYGSTRPLKTNSGTLLTGSFSARLKEAQFRATKKNCENFLICIKPMTRGDSVCMGDSGSPIHLTRRNGTTTVEGVASFVTGKKDRGSTVYCNGDAAYSRISYYSKWFKNKVGKNSYCKA